MSCSPSCQKIVTGWKGRGDLCNWDSSICVSERNAVLSPTNTDCAWGSPIDSGCDRNLEMCPDGCYCAGPPICETPAYSVLKDLCEAGAPLGCSWHAGVKDDNNMWLIIILVVVGLVIAAVAYAMMQKGGTGGKKHMMGGYAPNAHSLSRS